MANNQRGPSQLPSLLTLPLEVRSEIYYYTFYNYAHKIKHWGFASIHYSDPVLRATRPAIDSDLYHRCPPPLLLVSHQLRNEGLRVLFSRFIIYSDHTSCAKDDIALTIKRFSSNERALIQHFCTNPWARFSWCAAHATWVLDDTGVWAPPIALVPNLKSLRLQILIAVDFPDGGFEEDVMGDEIDEMVTDVENEVKPYLGLKELRIHFFNLGPDSFEERDDTCQLEIATVVKERLEGYENVAISELANIFA